jgi:hypothetical protein
VSGRIHAEDVETLRQLIGREKAGIAIDLEEVILVDREAVRLLAFCETNGTELRNCLAYIREWVTRERTCVGSEASDLNRGATENAEDL